MDGLLSQVCVRFLSQLHAYGREASFLLTAGYMRAYLRGRVLISPGVSWIAGFAVARRRIFPDRQEYACSTLRPCTYTPVRQALCGVAARGCPRLSGVRVQSVRPVYAFARASGVSRGRPAGDVRLPLTHGYMRAYLRGRVPISPGVSRIAGFAVARRRIFPDNWVYAYTGVRLCTHIPKSQAFCMISGAACGCHLLSQACVQNAVMRRLSVS